MYLVQVSFVRFLFDINIFIFKPVSRRRDCLLGTCILILLCINIRRAYIRSLNHLFSMCIIILYANGIFSGIKYSIFIRLRLTL